MTDMERFGHLIDKLRLKGVDGKIKVDNKHGRPFHWAVWIAADTKRYAWGEALTMLEAEQQMAKWADELLSSPLVNPI